MSRRRAVGPGSVRPTRSGALLVAVALGAGATGWLLGQPELSAIAATALLATAVALWWVVAAPRETTIVRTLMPPRTRVGDDVLVRVRITNGAARRTPVQRIGERAGVHGTVDLTVAPIPSGAVRDLTYRYPARHRGLHRIGPAHVTVEDPFGLVRSTRPGSRTDELVVLPRTWRLTPLPGAVGGHALERRTPLPSRERHDDDLASLRSYEPGDDLRRVHWRTSARQGRLVVRQHDPPWTRRTTVVLDVRRSCHDDDSFERAVSVVASLVELAAERGELVRVITTDGTDSGIVGEEATDALLDQLALVSLRPDGSLAATLDQLGRDPDGRLVVCTGALGAPGHAAVTGATRAWDRCVLVTTASATASDEPDPPVLVTWTGGDLDRVWAESTGPAIRSGVRS